LGLPLDKPSRYEDSPYFNIKVAPSTSKTSAFAISALSEEKSVATLTYPVSTDAGNIEVTAYKSTDLTTWEKTTSILNQKVDKFDIYKVEEQIPANGKIFFKLEFNK